MVSTEKRAFLKWPGQSPDLSPVEMLRHDLAIAMQTRRPKNTAEMKQLYKERSKIPPDRGAGLICNYRKCLRLGLLLPTEGQPVIKSKVSHAFSTLVLAQGLDFHVNTLNLCLGQYWGLQRLVDWLFWLYSELKLDPVCCLEWLPTLIQSLPFNGIVWL